MYNLQGIIRQNIVNSEIQNEKLGYISSNIANMYTNGYKSVRFEQLVNPHGNLTGVVRTEHSTGNLFYTQNKMDFAIDGPGFVPVTSKNGEISYTRDGSMKVNNQGYLLTNDDQLIGDGIKIPINYAKIKIESNGNVICYPDTDKEGICVGTIPIVTFINPEGLKAIGNNKYIATENSGEPNLLKDHTSIKQGYVEYANVDVYENIRDILKMNTATLAGFKVISAVNDLYTKSINLTE